MRAMILAVLRDAIQTCNGDVMPRVIKVLDSLKSPNSFFAWAVLAILVISMPTYIIVRSYGVTYSQQVQEMFLLVLFCILSIYICISIYEMMIEYDAGAADRAAAASMRGLDDVSYVDAQAEYESYIRKINTINDGRYVTKDGAVKTLFYSRSSDHVQADL